MCFLAQAIHHKAIQGLSSFLAELTSWTPPCEIWGRNGKGHTWLVPYSAPACHSKSGWPHLQKTRTDLQEDSSQFTPAFQLITRSVFACHSWPSIWDASNAIPHSQLLVNSNLTCLSHERRQSQQKVTRE